jgi:2-iminobutanoate/2-iminopropanoate deaminase
MEIINTKDVYDPIGPFSQSVITGNLIFTAGIGGIDLSGKVVSNNLEEQTEQCLKNIKTVLAASGASLQNVVKAFVYLTDIKDYEKVNAIYAKHMGDHRPARCCVAVKELPANELMKIEVIAEKPA